MMKDSDVKREIERMTENLKAGAKIHSDKGYSESTKGKPVSAEKQERLTEIFNSLPVYVSSKNEIEYFNLVTEHINHQLSWFGVRLANPSHETETRTLNFRPRSDLSMMPEALAEIYVNEILVGFGSDNIKEFTVAGLNPVPYPNGVLKVLIKGKWESK